MWQQPATHVKKGWRHTVVLSNRGNPCPIPSKVREVFRREGLPETTRPRHGISCGLITKFVAGCELPYPGCSFNRRPMIYRTSDPIPETGQCAGQRGILEMEPPKSVSKSAPPKKKDDNNTNQILVAFGNPPLSEPPCHPPSPSTENNRPHLGSAHNGGRCRDRRRSCDWTRGCGCRGGSGELVEGLARKGSVLGHPVIPVRGGSC